MRVKSRKWGLTARFSRFSELFGAVWTLLAGKQPKTKISNKGFHLTAHNWPSQTLWDINYALLFDHTIMGAEGEP